MNTQLNILVIALVVLVLLLIVMLVLIRINNKQQMENQKEQIRRLRARANEFMPPSLKALDDWKMEVHTAVKLAAKDRPTRRGEARDQYDRQVFESILHCNRYEYFFRLANEHLNGFASKMRNEYPLSDREVMFICLSLLALSDEQIALILDYSQASIPTTRKRICTKLGIANSADWNNHLLDLVQQS
ncbi:MAG: hypothetical protein IJQ95_06330 [Paludibacteraceae bacterium]|nr:hypothetical protein [Paludibacteraceae bacterium]